MLHLKACAFAVPSASPGPSNGLTSPRCPPNHNLPEAAVGSPPAGHISVASCLPQACQGFLPGLDRHQAGHLFTHWPVQYLLPSWKEGSEGTGFCLIHVVSPEPRAVSGMMDECSANISKLK